MRPSPRRTLALTSFTALAFVGVAVAAAPATYEGRPLPGIVKDLVWQKACNLPDAEEGACSTGPCYLRRADGTPFKPYSAPWQSVLMLEWTAAERTLGPAFAEGRLVGSIDDISGQTRVALELASGLPLQVGTDGNTPFKVNPALVAWVARELLPPADHIMCGGTATDLYRQAFQAPIRGLAETYAALQAKGMTKGVGLDALSRGFDTQGGRFAQACQAIAKKAVPDAEYARVQECWWWLRRVATGTSEPIAQLLGEILRRYDGEAWKKLGRAFPKAPKPAAIVAPR